VSKHYYFPHHNDTLASIKGERRTPENTEQALLAIEQAKTMTEKKEVMKNSGTRLTQAKHAKRSPNHPLKKVLKEGLN